MAKDKDVIICGICKASFCCDSFTSFMEHKLLHVNADQRINCVLCLKWFPKRNALQLHLERVHAIPQRNTASDRDSTTSTVASSSARCNPCPLVNTFETEQNPSANQRKLDSCFSLPNTQLHLSRSDVPLSLQQRHDNTTNNNNMDGIILHDNQSPENSNSSVDILSTDDPVIEFPLNNLNYYEDVCCNRLLMSDGMAEVLGNESAFSSSIAASKDKSESEFTSIKQYGNKELPPAEVSAKLNIEQSNNSMTTVEKSKPFVQLPEVVDEENRAKGEESGDKMEELETSTDKENIDFHFLLGTTSISGNSMKYERVEFRCMHCSFSSAWRPSLLKHMKIAHSDVLAFHEILNIQTATLSKPSSDQTELAKKYKIMKLSEHSKITLQNKTRKVKRLPRTVEYQDVPGKYTCPVCNKIFSRIRYIRRHQMTHKTQRTYLCDHCGKSFKTRSTLVAHTRSHNIKLYQCPQCDFVSNLTRAIHHHRQLHPNGSAVCEICGAVYTDKSTLKKHMRVHDPSRPFSCSESNCTWRFKSENLMKAHVKSHTIEGKFLCAYCGYRFRHKHHLQRHISRIHPQETLIESSSTLTSVVNINPSPIIPNIMEPSVSDLATSSFPSSAGISDSIQTQELSVTFNINPNGESSSSHSQANATPVVIPSNSGAPPQVESGHESHCQNQLPCDQTSVHQTLERLPDCSSQQADQQQNLIQVLSLMSSDGQEIVISLPPDISPDLLNNSTIANLGVSDVIQHVNSGQVFMVKDSQ